MTTPAEFAVWLEAVEGRNLEFKEARRTYEFDRLVCYIVALANEGGGKIILGVTDRRPRRVVGTQAFAEPGRTESGIEQRIGRRVLVEEYFHQTIRVLIVHVPPRDAGTAWNDQGTYWKRRGDSLVHMTDDDLRTVHAEAASDFSAQACAGMSIDGLDSHSIAEFRSRWAQRDRGRRIESWSDEETLVNAELMHDRVPNYAALILLGTRDALSLYLAQAEVVVEYRSGESAGPAQDRGEYRQGFLGFHDALWERINRRNDRQSYQEGFFRVDIPTFDEVIIREAVLNAVCHRDYRLSGSVFVRQYARRLEIVSPGGFPSGITAENVLDQQNPRNRRLAEALGRCGLVERAGQGVNLMVEQSVRQSKPLPDFGGTSAHEVRLVLDGTVTNPKFLAFLEKLGADTLASFGTNDLLVLDLLQRGESVPAHLHGRLGRLREAGVVESVGRGRGTRFFLSRALSAALGQKGVYTRRRGLDHDTNKELLLKHIRENPEGCPLSELEQVLPQLSRRQVRGLLTELRSGSMIELRGTRRWARWLAAGTAKDGA